MIDRTVDGVRQSVGMKRLFTKEVTFTAYGFSPVPVCRTLLEDERIGLVEGKPEELVGGKDPEGVKMSDGRAVPCEAVPGWGGISMNDEYLTDLALERDADGFKIVTNAAGETSVRGLFVVDALRRGGRCGPAGGRPIPSPFVSGAAGGSAYLRFFLTVVLVSI